MSRDSCLTKQGVGLFVISYYFILSLTDFIKIHIKSSIIWQIITSSHLDTTLRNNLLSCVSGEFVDLFPKRDLS
jgi:hypothetical protein